MEDDYTEPVCCETPMERHDDRDPYGQAYYYYICFQCGYETDAYWADEGPGPGLYPGDEE